SSQRAYAINAIGKSHRLVVGRLQIAPGLDLFPDVVEVTLGIESVGHDLAGGIDDTELSVVEGEAVILFNDTHEHRGKISEAGNFFAEVFHSPFEPFQGSLDNAERVRDGGEDSVAVHLAQWLADAAGNDPRRMNALSAQPLDDLLSELA